jgi:zinc protease
MIVLLACSCNPAMALDPLKFEQYKLDNGLTVILHEDHSAPLATVEVMYHVGSKNEKPKRTGFAHLFEHIMFKGSEHVADDEHFKLLQEIGGTLNGSTTEDRTNYFETVPSNYVELALYLESDRMGFLLPAITQQKLDNQRDVVKNERRQRVDNVPYGTAFEKISKAMFPENHPYNWPVIGYMEDLSAASMGDVKEFFRLYYAPNNACLVVAGDFDRKQTKEWIAKYFGPLPKGAEIVRPHPDPVVLAEEKHLVFEDKVQLPRLYLSWVSPAGFTREDAVMDVLGDILTTGKSSRLYKNLVYEKQIAQTVSASESSSELVSQFNIVVTAKPGKTLTEMETAVNQELERLLKDGVTEQEVQSAVSRTEATLINRRATVGQKADGLASAYTLSGDVNNYNRDFDRYLGITPAEVLAQAKKILTANKIVLSVVPEGKRELAAEQKNIKRKESAE